MNKKLLTTLLSILITTQTHAKDEAVEQYADVHFHVSNYAAQGISLKTFIDDYMGKRIARSVVMPIPLHQKWDSFEQYAKQEIAPNYYLGPKAELYYYSFVDAMVAQEYQHLSKKDQARLDPMITGFNPMDYYAAQQIKRVLLTFPGVFSGIGEFTVHKEIVSDKVAGDTVKKISGTGLPPDSDEDDKLTLYSPSLVAIFNVAAETGLVALLHNDVYKVDVNYAGTILSKSFEPHYVTGMKYLCQASPDAKVIWAHTGLGRFVQPLANHLDIVSDVLDTCPNWSVDISWDLVQQHIVHPASHMPSLKEWISFINKYQDRVLWGTDAVMYSSNKVENNIAIKGQRISVEKYYDMVDVVNPLFDALDADVAKKVRLTNYLRLFDTARMHAREWEKRHAKDDVWDIPVTLPAEDRGF
jgi:hypothetical protein